MTIDKDTLALISIVGSFLTCSARHTSPAICWVANTDHCRLSPAESPSQATVD